MQSPSQDFIMERISIADAERDLTTLVERVVSEGVSVDLERNNKVVARISPVCVESKLKVCDFSTFLVNLPGLGEWNPGIDKSRWRYGNWGLPVTRCAEGRDYPDELKEFTNWKVTATTYGVNGPLVWPITEPEVCRLGGVRRPSRAFTFFDGEPRGVHRQGQINNVIWV